MRKENTAISPSLIHRSRGLSIPTLPTLIDSGKSNGAE
jgi:hypothetical protein